MPASRNHGWRIAALVGILCAVTVGAFLWMFDWNWLKSPIENVVTSSTGRRLEIQGNLQGEWRRYPRIRMEQVRFDNPDWAKAPHLLTADAVEIKIALWPLLHKQVHIHELSLQKPAIFLERLKDGRATWLFDREQRDKDTAPQIDVLSVDDGTLQFQDAITDTRLSAKLQDKPSTDDPRSLKFRVQGTYRAQPLDLQGATAPLLSLQDSSQRLPLVVKGIVAGTQIALDGEIEGLTRFDNMALDYDIRGRSLRQLALVFGVPLLETPPYAVSGILTRTGRRWESRNLKGKVGASDISGNVVVTTGGQKPQLQATLNSALLDLADLGPLIGTAPRVNHTASADSRRLLPTRAFDLSRIRELNAQVTLRAKRVVRAADFPFDDFLADFRLKDARITIDPLEFGMADGRLRSKVVLDARQPTMQAAFSGRMDGMRVEKIFPQQAAVGKAAGTLSGVVDLHGRGNSVSAMVASSSGRTTLLLANGRVPSLLPAAADLDGARIIASYLGKQPESVRCAAIDLQVAQGIATPNVAVFETDTTVLTTTGTIDLRDEKLALKLAQAPKNPSFLSARTPINVSGTLKQPRWSLDAGPLVARGAAAIVLGIINPLAAAFSLVETGPGKDGACPAIQRGFRSNQQHNPESGSTASRRP